MAFTFDQTLPTEKDQIRFALGDVVTPGHLLEDESIQAQITLYGNWKMAGAVLAEGLAAQYALEPDSVSITGIGSFSWRERVDQWMSTAARLRAEVNQEAAALAGNGFRSDRAYRDDGDRQGEYVAYGSWRD